MAAQGLICPRSIRAIEKRLFMRALYPSNNTYFNMFAIGLPQTNACPTVSGYIFHSIFGLFFAALAVWMTAALFSERLRLRLHWGNGLQMSRLSILLALPFTMFIPARYIVYLIAAAAGPENTWTVPNWWFFPCVALFILGTVVDRLRNR
jgi:hypothetical protein